MTDARTTQAAIEQWTAPNPDARASQVSIEQWGLTGAVGTQAIATQVALEEWAVNPSAASIGNADGQASVSGVGNVVAGLLTTGQANGQATVSGVGGGIFVLSTTGEVDGHAAVSGVGQVYLPPNPRGPPVAPHLREMTYRRRFLGVSFDPTLVISKDRPGPLRIVEVDYWMN